jgi:hypothetical protein
VDAALADASLCITCLWKQAKPDAVAQVRHPAIPSLLARLGFVQIARRYQESCRVLDHALSVIFRTTTVWPPSPTVGGIQRTKALSDVQLIPLALL